jgi:protein SEY1
MQYYLSNIWYLKDQGLDYHIVAVFGSQSSGKSTLLNGIFNTKFAVMKENARCQTTRGPCSFSYIFSYPPHRYMAK